MRNMTRRLERLETASGYVNLDNLLQAPEDEQQRFIENLSDAELDRLIDEIKAGEEIAAI